MALNEINLIPEDMLKRRHLIRHLAFWAGCLCCILCLVLGYYFYQTFFVLEKERTVAALEEDIQERLGMRIEGIRKIREELKNLDKQQSLLDELERIQPATLVLSKLAENLNRNTWLTEFNMDLDEEEPQRVLVELTGYSFSSTELGYFVTQLSKSRFFKDVLLQYADETDFTLPNANPDDSIEDVIKIIRFKIACSLQET